MMRRYAPAYAMLAVTLLLVAGCVSQPHEVGPSRITIDDAYSIDPQVAWTGVREGDDYIWTIDGPRLSLLRLVVAEPGEPMLDVADAELRKRLPVWRAGMTPIELQESLEALLAAVEYQQLQTIAFQPARFGMLPGYRLEFTAVAKDGLDQRGTALTTEKDGTFYMLLHIGTKLHYFDRHAPVVERMIQSIQIL